MNGPLGITLRTISPKAYRLLRDQKIIPLPCETVLKESYAHFQLGEGTVLRIVLFHSMFTSA